MAYAHRNDLAKKLRALHIPGTPVIFANVYDGATAKAVAQHPYTKAVASASFAIAETSGTSDPELTLEDNLAGVRRIARLTDQAGLPLTADMQDGYADIATNIEKAIAVGAVGCNIEDVHHESGQLRDLDDAVARIKTAVSVASKAGVPDFCVNARTDTLVYGGSIDEAIKRGKAFLKAGALTVYVWGGPSGRGLRDGEIRQLVDAFGGMLNVKMNLRPGFLQAREIADLGVARISIGPELYHKAMAGFKGALNDMYAKK